MGRKRDIGMHGQLRKEVSGRARDQAPCAALTWVLSAKPS